MSGSSEVPSTSDPKATDWDRALPFQLDALGVRGRLVRLGPALDAIIERHGYPLAVARPLAEAMTLCAALATSLKYDGIFTLQISGDGPIRLLVTDLTSDGALRGYAQFDSWKLAVALGGVSEAPEGYVPRLFGHGTDGRRVVGIHADKEVIVPVAYRGQIVLQHAANHGVFTP